MSYQHEGKHPANAKFSPGDRCTKCSGSSFFLLLSFGCCLEPAAAPCVAGVGLRGAAAARAGAEAVTGALCRLQLPEWAGKAQKTKSDEQQHCQLGSYLELMCWRGTALKLVKKPKCLLAALSEGKGGATGRGVTCVPPKPFVSPPSPW